MKKMLFYGFLFLIPLFGFAQEQTQNPNADVAAQKYEAKLSNHESAMGSTVQNTYTARDPRQERIDERKARKEDKREFRQTLRLERARRPYVINRRNPWYNTYPYGF